MIKRTDRNQKDIMDRSRTIPALSVVSTHTIGKGFPDIVVGYRGRNYLFEIKDGSKARSATKLTPDEMKFHALWNGQVKTIYSFEDMLKELQII